MNYGSQIDSHIHKLKGDKKLGEAWEWGYNYGVPEGSNIQEKGIAIMLMILL